MNTLSFQNENKTAAPEAAENSRLAAIKKWSRGAVAGLAIAGTGLAAAQPAAAQTFKVTNPISKNYDGGYSGSGLCPDGKRWSYSQSSISERGSVFIGDRLVGTSDPLNAMGVAIENCGHPLAGWDVEKLKSALENARYAEEEDCAGQKVSEFDDFCKGGLHLIMRNVLSAAPR